jgi:hypothetical protein
VSLFSQRWGEMRNVGRDDEDALADELAPDVGDEHARKVARVIVECGFSAEEICCVNGYTEPSGDPELVALACIGWPLADTRRVLERWAEDAWMHHPARARA